VVHERVQLHRTTAGVFTIGGFSIAEKVRRAS
jgi:hypothetical protein